MFTESTIVFLVIVLVRVCRQVVFRGVSFVCNVSIALGVVALFFMVSASHVLCVCVCGFCFAFLPSFPLFCLPHFCFFEFLIVPRFCVLRSDSPSRRALV